MNMKITKSLLQAGVLGMSLLATSVMAAVSASDAAKLGTSLTPMGAEKAGNAANTIPAWSPLPKNAGAVDSKGFLANPYASEKPLFTITAANVEQYKDKLAPGQYAMFKRYPDSYRIPVYPTHRGATVPDEVFAAIKKNATTTKLVGGGSGLENFDTAIPFPIPASGVEVIWNHITRYRGGSVKRLVTQATPQPNGSYSLVYFYDQFVFRDKMRDFDPKNPGNILFYFKQEVTRVGGRDAGGVAHEALRLPCGAGSLSTRSFELRRESGQPVDLRQLSAGRQRAHPRHAGTRPPCACTTLHLVLGERAGAGLIVITRLYAQRSW